MIELLYLTYNRLKFTQFSVERLLSNTNPALLSGVVFYDDNSSDGTSKLVELYADAIRSTDLRVAVRRSWFGSPIAVMNHYVQNSRSDFFVKLDSDVVVPPGWLDRCWEVMSQNDHLDLLGIEPPMSRTPAPWLKGALANAAIGQPSNRFGWIKTDSIGGIGLMRSRVFREHPPMKPHHRYGGFGDFQVEHKNDLGIGWIDPPLNVFLLDRLPIEPWRSLSDEYMRKGWQRPWTNYTMAEADLWSWCDGMLRDAPEAKVVTSV